MIFYLVYRTTNLANGHFYIGVHRTEDLNDSYLGSGSFLRKAIKKYGKESFCREILFIFDNAEEMWQKEAELVSEDLVKSPNCYNAHLGGDGGWSHVDEQERLRGLHNWFEKREEDKQALYLESPAICPVCGKAIQYAKRKNKYCSRMCANDSRVPRKRGWQNYSKEKQLKILKNLEKGRRKEAIAKMTATRREQEAGHRSLVKAKYARKPPRCVMCKRALPYEKRGRKTCSFECLCAFRRQSMAKRMGLD